MELNRKIAIVTGGNSGVGLATAGALAKEGVTVFIACRSSDKAAAAIKAIHDTHGSDCEVGFLPLNLDSLDSVVKCAEDFLSLQMPLHILVNNAGMLASSLTAKSEDGFERTLQVNLLGHYLFTLLLMPALQLGKPSVVINVASLVHGQAKMDLDTLEHWRLLLKQYSDHEHGSHSDWPSRKELFPISSPSSPPPTLNSLYSTSKLGNMLFSLELNRRYAHTGISSFSMCPGVVATDILKEFNAFVRISGYMVMRGAVYLNAACSAETSAKTVLAILNDPEAQGGTYWTYSKEAKPHPYALDTVTSYRLWELCWDLTEVERRAPDAKEFLANQRILPLHVCGGPPLPTPWKLYAIFGAIGVVFLAMLVLLLK